MNCSTVSLESLTPSSHLPAHQISTYLTLRPLVHHLSPLLLDNHLLLAVRQRPRDAQQQRAGRYDPQRLAAKQQPALRPAADRLVLGCQRSARAGRDYVFQRADALVEGLVGRHEGGFGFEVGLCKALVRGCNMVVVRRRIAPESVSHSSSSWGPSCSRTNSSSMTSSSLTILAVGCD